MNQDPFKEYIKQAEVSKKDKSFAWATAIGLQAVDGLEPSEYLKQTAIRNIEGEITIHEASEIIESYYKEVPIVSSDDRTEEADKVAVRIAVVLSERAFTFSPSEYIGIHKRLFSGIYKHAGQIRDYNITKKEWVLDGETVLYGSATELKATLEYDFQTERSFNYKGLTIDETIRHLAFFISRLWQIHIFGEGNTRTTAVFFIKYLRSLGFEATNDIFAENAWYFRNSLVRANYSNVNKSIHETTEYLEVFLRNLILKENNILSNRIMHISGFWKKEDVWGKKQDIRDKKPDIQDKKPDIQDKKPDIQNKKPDIQDKKPDIQDKFSDIVAKHIINIFNEFGYKTEFGRTNIMQVLGLGKSSASELINKMLSADIIIPVKGKGKGKYTFKR